MPIFIAAKGRTGYAQAKGKLFGGHVEVKALLAKLEAEGAVDVDIFVTHNIPLLGLDAWLWVMDGKASHGAVMSCCGYAWQNGMS